MNGPAAAGREPDIETALAVILDYAVERGGEVSTAIRRCLIASLALFPVAVRGTGGLGVGQCYRCARTTQILGSVRLTDPTEARRRYTAVLHTKSTRTSRLLVLPGRHAPDSTGHDRAFDELTQALIDRGWAILDVASWRREARSQVEAFDEALLPLKRQVQR